MTDKPTVTTPAIPPALMLGIKLPADMQYRASTVIVSREMGPWRRLLGLVVPMAGAFALSFLMGWILELPLSDAGLVGLYGFIGAVVGFVLIRRVLARRMVRIQSTSAFRQSEVGVQLDEGGLTFTARTLPWAAVSGLARWNGCTLVHFSAADALVIPDSALPPGTTPQTLAADIEVWKAAPRADR
jgi:hypothetical protein